MLYVPGWTMARYHGSLWLWSKSDPGRPFVSWISLLAWFWNLCIINSYQRLYFRNVNHPISRPSVVTRRHDVRASTSQSTEQESSKDLPGTHIFDGVHLTTETAAFQLCDIHDSMLKEMIEDEDAVRDECNVRNKNTIWHAQFLALGWSLPF